MTDEHGFASQRWPELEPISRFSLLTSAGAFTSMAGEPQLVGIDA